MDELDLVVMSPGVPTDLPVVNRMREKKIPIIGEVELAYELGRGDVLAIRGPMERLQLRRFWGRS